MAPDLLIALDLCGESSLPRCLAVDQQARVGVVGTIRLDRAIELSRELKVDSAAGDAALVMAAYLRWGASAFSRLSGDFSFLLWDDAAQHRYLARDPFGVRRLHYATIGEAVAFSTEVEGVLAWPTIDRTPDPVTILDNLLARYRTSEQTFFRFVKRVPPGHHLFIGRGGSRLVRHVEVPRRSSPFRSLAEYADAFRFELTRSVQERLPTTGAVGVHVSGGLDSMSIASLASVELSRSRRRGDVTLLNARFAGLSSDEGSVAHELSRHLGVPLRQWDGRVPEISDLQRCRLAWPFGRSSIAGSRQGDLELASQHGASIILAGAGGNQVAMESGFFRDLRGNGDLPAYGRALFQVAAEGAPWRWPRRHLRRTLAEAKAAFRGGGWRGSSSRAATTDLQGPDWLGPALREAWTSLPDAADEESGEPRTGTWMGDAIWDSVVEDPTHVWTLEHEDARATERGFEFRFPYLSWELLALVLSVPAQLRPPGPRDRRLQRLALRGVLPEQLRTRDTVVDFTEAITLNTEASRRTIEEIVTTGPWKAEGFIDRAAVARELSTLARSVGGPFTDQRGQAWRRIRDVAALEAWLREV